MADPYAPAATDGTGPLIVACLRHTDLRPLADPLTGQITHRSQGATAAAVEFAALETALRIAEAWQGHVLALTAGPPAADATLREALAVGASALRVDWPPQGCQDAADSAGGYTGGGANAPAADASSGSGGTDSGGPPATSPGTADSGAGSSAGRSGGDGVGWSGGYTGGAAGGDAGAAKMSAVGSRRGRAGAGSSGADRSRSGHLDADWSAGQWLADLAGDESALAAALAAAIRPARPGLVVCGDRSAGRGTGALPAFLAHELGATQALGLVSVEVAGDALVAHRRLPAGRRETIRVVPPAVCSVEAAGIRLRCASLPAALAARRATVPVVSPAAPAAPAATVRLGVPRPYLPRTHVVPAAPVGAARERVLALSGALARHETATVIGPVSPAEAAAELLAYLARTGTTQAPASIATTAGPAARAPSHPASPAAVAAPDSATKAATRPARQPTTPDGES